MEKKTSSISPLLSQALILVPTLLLLSSCRFLEKIEAKARDLNTFEAKSLEFAKENRQLKIVVSKLQFELKNLEEENHFLKLKVESRGGAVRGSMDGPGAPGGELGTADNVREDMVKFNVYHWRPEELLAMAQDSFSKKDYEKSAQCFYTFVTRFPKHESLDDQVLFQSGVAAYKSQNHYNWSIDHLKRLLTQFPSSRFFRGAKLWESLSQYKKGNYKSFFNTVEEFRLKYRNTPEWNILSAHYEEYAHKFKK